MLKATLWQRFQDTDVYLYGLWFWAVVTNPLRGHLHDLQEWWRGDPHPTTQLRYGEELIDVDTEIAPLLLEMWQAGIDTDMSCQGGSYASHRGWIMLGFPRAEDLTRFLTISAPPVTNDPTIIYTRMHTFRHSPNPKHWRYSMRIADRHEPRKVEISPRQYKFVRECPVIDFEMNVRLQFPVADYPAVLAAFQRHQSGGSTVRGSLALATI